MRIQEDIPILGKVNVNFLELSTKIFNLYIIKEEILRQKNSPHLGLISQAFKNSNHSRYDYLILQCVISEIIENTFKGTTNAQGSITVKTKKYFGNDIVKSWILLSNFGHCKNTIGDEKTLLLHCIQYKSFQNHLLRCVKDEKLKKWSKKVIEDFDYVNFHHIISFYRIYKSLKRKVQQQNEIFLIYKLLLLPEEDNIDVANPSQISQLKTIYKILRDISIISLDSRNSSLPINLDILTTIFSIDSFENRYQNLKISSLLEPLHSILCDNLYLNIKSQTHQRSYEITALETNNFNLDEILEKAINAGLTDPTICVLEHFLRIKLNIKNMVFEDLSHAIRHLLTVKKGVDNVEASMDINPFNENRVIDFYFHNDFDKNNFSLFIYNIGEIILSQIIGTATNEYDKTKKITDIVKHSLQKINLTEEERTNFQEPIKKHINLNIKKALLTKNLPAYKEILWSVLRFHIDDKYHFDIDHHTTQKYNYFGVKVSDLNSLNENLDLAIKSEKDPDRIHELEQVKRSSIRKFDGTVIVCLARIKIYDYSLSPEKRIITDIDGVVLKFNSEELILELHESKNTAKPIRDAVKDLKAKLIKTLNKNSKGFKISPIKDFGGKVYIKHNNNNV